MSKIFLVSYFNCAEFTYDSDGDKVYPNEKGVNRISTIIIKAEDKLSVLKELIQNHKEIYPFKNIKDVDCNLTSYRLKKIYSLTLETYEPTLKIEEICI